MAKRKAVRRKKSGKKARPAARRPAKRTIKRATKRKAPAKKRLAAKKASKKAASVNKAVRSRKSLPTPSAKVPRLDRARRILDEAETHTTPPSSLDMNQQHGSAARSGRAGMEHSRRDHRGMSDVTGGDPDVDVEDAYFAGEEAPGGDNPTPDQDIVEDIGKALGVTYNDNEELEASDKVVKRDKHRWELDPASSEDYRERK